MWQQENDNTMQIKLNKLFASAIDVALSETDRTMQERVANGAIAVWNETKQNAIYNVSEDDAFKLAFNAQKKDTLARNKRLNVQVDVPETTTFEHKKFTTFSNNVQRLKLTIVNAPHLTKAMKIVDALIKDDVVKQTGLVLHKAMEAVGAGTGETWEADKRKTSSDSVDKRKKTDAEKVTPAGFTLRLTALIDEAAKLNIEMVQDAEIGSWSFAQVIPPAAEKVIEDMPDSKPVVMDADSLKAMMGMPEFQNAMMAAFQLGKIPSPK